MTVKSSAVSVTTSATRLDSADSADDGQPGQSVAVYNNGTATIYLGGSSVTTATGSPVPAGTWGPSMDLTPAEGLYGIVASGTQEARVLEVGVT